MAPLSLTRVMANDNASRRIVGTAAPGRGGSNGFSTVRAQTAVGNYTLAAPEVPNIVIDDSIGLTANTGDQIRGGGSFTIWTGGNTSKTTTGGGGAHNHSILLSMKYVEALIAKKS